MKKIIAVAAGLMLVGSAVAASAEVTFTGNTRSRLAIDENYGSNQSHDDYGNNRFRLQIHAVTKGGAYADARLFMGDATDLGYGGNSSYKGWVGTTNTDSQIFVDWSYVGIPMGPVTVRAGKIPDFSSVWFVFDKRNSGIDATWANKMTSVTGAYYKHSSLDSNTFNSSGTIDQDQNWFAVQVNQKFAANWAMMFYGIYQDDQANTGYLGSQADGFIGTARVEGPAGPVKILAELSYKDADVQGTKDNGYGGIVHAKAEFGPASATGVLGFTKNGFLPDGNYGFIMMGQAMGGGTSYLADFGMVGSPAAVMAMGNSKVANGDSWFIGVVGDYKISKTIKLVGDIAYNDDKDYGKFIEVAGLVRFDVVEGAYIDVGAGYLNKSYSSSYSTAAWRNNNDNAAVGAFTELGISF